MIVAIGVDLSLTSTGLAAVDDNGGATVKRIRTPAAATLEQRCSRLAAILGHVVVYSYALEPQHGIVAIEGPSLRQRAQVGTFDRAGLWWLVVHALDDLGLTVVEIPPKSRAKYATGNGNAGKDEVLAAVVKRYPTVDVTGNDVADALVLAAMAARMLGRPVEERLPATHTAALTGVHWPTRLASTG